MSKIIRTRKPSVLPYYAAALVFVVLCAVLPVYRLWALAAALAAAAAAFLAAKKVCPPRVVETEVPFHTGVEDVDAMLADIQQKLDTLHSLNESLPDPQLSAAMTRMEKAGRSIVEVVEANPAKAKQVRRFANYYLPDAVNVLQQYAQLARQGVRGENAAAIRAALQTITQAEEDRTAYSEAPANAFGELMAELFTVKADRWTPVLRQFGRSLGKLIYFMDAACDLEEDRKKGQYNPLALLGVQSGADFRPQLTLLAGDAAEAFERLPIVQDAAILQNILYSGVWTRFEAAFRTKQEEPT